MFAKRLSILSILTITFGLAALLIRCTPSSEEPDCKRTDVLCVGLVTDVGAIDDKSFNQSSWEGVQLAVAKLRALGNYIETKDAKDYRANIELFTSRHYDLIVTVGFGLGEATVQAAAKYPGINFIGVDQFQANTIPNLTGLIFHEDRAGFMAGALAAMLSESGVIAAVPFIPADWMSHLRIPSGALQQPSRPLTRGWMLFLLPAVRREMVA
jgi:basic membrane protein A